MNHVEKTLELVARVMRLQQMARPAEIFHIEYSGNVNALQFYKTGEIRGERVVHYYMVHYFGESYGDTLEAIEAKIKEEEDIHRDLI